MKKVLLLIMMMAVLVGCSSNNATPANTSEKVEEVPNTAVVSVDGTPIDIAVFNKYYAMQSYDFEKEFGKSVWDIEKDGKSMREIRQDQTLDYLIRINLIESYLTERGVTVDNQIIDEAYTKYMASIAGDAELQAYLVEHGLDKEFLTRFIVDQYYLREYENHVLDEIINNPETDKLLFENRYIRYKTRHILFDNQESVDEVLALLNDEEEPADFSDMARIYSIHSTSAVRGGDLGYIIVGNMPNEYEAAALNNELYTVSEPIQTEYGIHLIFVDDRQTLQDMIDVGMPEDEIETYKLEIIKKYAATETVRIIDKLMDEATIDFNKELINGN